MTGAVEEHGAVRPAPARQLPTEVFSAAHDVQKRLTAILGFAELLRSGPIRPDANVRDALLERIIANALNASRLVDRLLADGSDSFERWN